MIHDEMILLARLLIAALFVSGGWPKLLGSPDGRAAIASLGLPMAGASQRLVGLSMMAGSVALILGTGVRIAALLLAAFVLVVTPLFMPFWKTKEPEARTKVREAFFDNVGILGGLIALAAVGAGNIALLPGS